MGGLKTDLKLIVFLSCLRIMVLGSPPLPEEAPGVVASVRVRGVRREFGAGAAAGTTLEGSPALGGGGRSLLFKTNLWTS